MNIFNKRMRAIIAYNEIFRDIVVNPLESFIVWSRVDQNFRIIKANQDGSDRKVLIDTNLYESSYFVIDFETKRIYFWDYLTNELSSIDFNGNNRILINGFKIYGNDFKVKSLDIYDGNFYVYSYESDEIMKVSTDGLILNKIKIGDDIFPKNIKIIHSSRQPNGENKCIGSNCTHLCLPNQYKIEKFTCMCPSKDNLVPGEICESVRYYIKHLSNFI